MSKYKDVFKRVIREADIPDFARNPADANISDDLNPDMADEFNVDVGSGNVGFQDMNFQRDVETLKKIVSSSDGKPSEIEVIAKKVKELGDLAKRAGRSFEQLISDVPKEIANINDALNTFKSVIERQIIMSDSIKDKEAKDREKEAKKGMM